MNSQQAAEQFVDLWVQAKQMKEGEYWIAAQLGITRQAVNFKANRLRAQGVRLPGLKFKNAVTSKLDVAALNRRIKEARVKM